MASWNVDPDSTRRTGRVVIDTQHLLVTVDTIEEISHDITDGSAVVDRDDQDVVGALEERRTVVHRWAPAAHQIWP